jgi:hypothetical protein
LVCLGARSLRGVERRRVLVGNADVRRSIRGFIDFDGDGVFNVPAVGSASDEQSYDINLTVALPTGGAIDLQCIPSDGTDVLLGGRITEMAIGTLNGVAPLPPKGSVHSNSANRASH